MCTEQSILDYVCMYVRLSLGESFMFLKHSNLFGICLHCVNLVFKKYTAVSIRILWFYSSS